MPSDAADVRIVTEPGAILRGWLREPVAARESGRPGPVALVIHGWGASAADMVPLSQPLLDAGLRVLLLDARAHGRSGDVGVATMPTFAEDLRTALGWLRRQPGIDPDRIVLVGHSVGAGAALFVAADDHAIAGVISISSMAAPREFMAERLRARLPGPAVWLALRYVEHIIGHRFAEFSPLYTIGRSTAPVLLVHGALDSTIPLADAERLHARIPDRSTLLVLPEADHADFGSIQEGKLSLLRFVYDAGVHPGGTTCPSPKGRPDG
ncbi:MAG: alpha/beta fold hydrolase [Nocardioides sp.]|nr:alpha/beta fold hydrolase [Nocardioides sp.]